jgi:succinate-semialdehyde dehydrogenase/glutarate-semialdehyde dehydrogenase
MLMATKKARVKAKRKKRAVLPKTQKKSSSKQGVSKMKSSVVRKKTQKQPTKIQKIQSINPYTEEVMTEFSLMNKKQVEWQVTASRQSFLKWKDIPVSERAKYMKKLAEVLRSEKRPYAELITKEMGKPIKEALAEVEKCAWLADYYADNSSQFLKPEEVKTEARKSYVMFQPLGIVLAIMPWNFPFWQAFRFGVPSVMAGNVVLLKHASNVPMTALAIEESFKKAGFPDSVFKTLLIDVPATLRLIDEDKVDAVSLTGSNRAGEEVGAYAGRKIKKVVLELGGSDPFIVLDDADVEKAGRMAANARMINTGQSCIAAKRFIVMDKVASEFTKHFMARLKEMKLGDPMDETTDIGTVARKDILDGLKEQLRDARAKGARILEGGQTFDKGLFFTPCVVLNPKPNMKVMTEEVFGPIAPIIAVRDEDEAVAVANATEYGLGASIWSRDLNRAERLGARIESGFVAINDTVKSDPRLPFGGIKKSGVGRELSHYGLKEFVNIKTVVVKE